MPDAYYDWEEVCQEADWAALGEQLRGRLLHLLADTSKRRGEEHLALFAKFASDANLAEVVSKFISSEPSLSSNAEDQKIKILENLARLRVQLRFVLGNCIVLYCVVLYIKHSINKISIELSCVRTLTLDSCATNMGKLNGLVVQIARALEQLVAVVGCDLHLLQFMLTNGIAASFRDKSQSTDEIHCLQGVYKAAYLLGLNWKEHCAAMDVFYEEQEESWQKGSMVQWFNGFNGFYSTKRNYRQIQK
jgi:hypothetical protein